LADAARFPDSIAGIEIRRLPARGSASPGALNPDLFRARWPNLNPPGYLAKEPIADPVTPACGGIK
jgi:hypothetical protein